MEAEENVCGRVCKPVTGCRPVRFGEMSPFVGGLQSSIQMI